MLKKCGFFNFWKYLLKSCCGPYNVQKPEKTRLELHKASLRFDFALKLIILRQNSKKKYIKYPKSSKFYKRGQILNCLEFNNYWILLYKLNFHWKISMSVNIFPLEVFEFGVSLSSILDKWSRDRRVLRPPPDLALVMYVWIARTVQISRNKSTSILKRQLCE